METLLFIIILFPLVKGLCMALKPRMKRKPQQARPAVQSNATDNLNALAALQAQRETIENTIAELTGWLDVSETAAETLRVRNAIAAQYGKLATVEKNIKKLTG